MPAKTIFITGTSTGIGYAAARDLKARGWRVIASVRQVDDARRLEREIGVETVVMDLADETAVRAGADRALELSGGRIDALFNNGAYGQPGAVEDLTPALLREQFEVNLIAQHALARRLIPQMRARGDGRIVQCSSVLGLVVAPYRGAYCASKFALEALSDCLRLELAGTGIHVSLIEPGPIATPFVAKALARFRATIDIAGSVYRDAYERRLGEMQAGGKTMFKLPPEAVVAKLVHAIESPRPKPRYFVTKATYLADVARRVLPTRLLDRVIAGQ